MPALRKASLVVAAVVACLLGGLLVYAHFADGSAPRAAGSIVTLIKHPIDAIFGGENSADPGSEAAAFGAEAGVLDYGELKRALPKSEQAALGSDGSASLVFADGSRARSSFPPEEIGRLAGSAEAGQAEVTIRNSESGGSWFGADIIRLWILGAVVFGLIFIVGSVVNRRRKALRSKAAGTVGAGTAKSQEEIEDDQPQCSFADVAGCDEAVEEISEFVDFIRDPERFERVGARIPSGGILHGPPGTGKTLLAKALAGEAQVPFFYISGAEAVHKYVGVGADTIRKLFFKARIQEEGAVVFIDEIDAIGRTRSPSDEQASREYDQTLNQLLVELDGFKNNDKVVVLGATNRLDVLDPALLRPGRLSRHIPVLPPSEEGRRKILALYVRDKPLADDVDLDTLARITAGSTGADLADMANEAAIQAARRGADRISEADLREGHLRALAGPQRASSTMRPEEEKQIACHEAGHVICAELSPEHEKAQRVTIISRGQAAGLAVYGREDRSLHSPEYLRQQLVSILGGRAAERVSFGTVSSGAANDLQVANELARRAIEEWGLSQLTGQLVSRGQSPVSDQTRSLVDQEVEEMVANAFADAVALLEENRSKLESLTEALLEQKTLERIDILAVLGPETKPEARPLHPGPGLKPVIRKSEAAEVSPSKSPRRPAWRLAKSMFADLRGRRRKKIPTV